MPSPALAGGGIRTEHPAPLLHSRRVQQSAWPQMEQSVDILYIRLLFMSRLNEFRLYYNTTIHPELMRTERLRIRLLWLLFVSLIVLVVILVFAVSLGLFLVSILLSIPVAGYLFYLLYRMRRFTQTFKPRIVGLILDFMNNTLNYQGLKYEPQEKIKKETFLESQLFATDAPYYIGEDYIHGMVGEMPFGMSELMVREYSPLTSKLQSVFEGVFLFSIFSEQTEGRVVVWPRARRQYLIRSIKEYTWMGGRNQDHEINNARFREYFLVYAMPDTHVQGILSEPMQEALVNYVEQTGKDIYISFIDRLIFAGIGEPKDLLEPSIFRTNVSFDLIREFYLDINLALKIIEDFDQTH